MTTTDPGYYSRLDNLDGLGTHRVTTEFPRLRPTVRPDPIHPAPVDEPVTPETKRGSRALFLAATLVLIAVAVWLTVAVRDAIEQGVLL